MRTRLINSPYCDLKFYQNSNKSHKPYKLCRDKKIFLATDKMDILSPTKFDNKSQSLENLLKLLRNHERMWNGSGDYHDLPASVPNYKELSSRACQTILKSKSPAQVVQRVSSHNLCLFNHHAVSKRSSGTQRLLRYLLTLSNTTFNATFQQEIDVLKQEKKLLENDVSSQSKTISRILRNQAKEKQKLARLIVQNEMLEEAMKENEKLLKSLSADIEELKTKVRKPPGMYIKVLDELLKNTEIKKLRRKNRMTEFSKSHPLIITKLNKICKLPSSPALINCLDSVATSSNAKEEPVKSGSKVDASNSQNSLQQKTIGTSYCISDFTPLIKSSHSIRHRKAGRFLKLFCYKS